MFGIGPLEFGIFFVLVLVVVGPDRLPTFMRTIGKALREIRRAGSDFRDAVGMDDMMRDADVRPQLEAPVVAPIAAEPTLQQEQQAQPLNDDDLSLQASDAVRAESVPLPLPEPARISSVPAAPRLSSEPPPLSNGVRKSSIPPPAPIEAFGESILPEEDAT